MDKEMLKRVELNLYAASKSIERLRKATNEKNYLEIYSSIGEALLWICNSDDWFSAHIKEYKKKRSTNENGKLILGLRYAFNSLKHNMKFFTMHKKRGGSTFPIRFPVAFPTITFNWSDVDEKFDGIPKQKQNYKILIEGKEVYITLHKSIEFLKLEFMKLEDGEFNEK